MTCPLRQHRECSCTDTCKASPYSHLLTANTINLTPMQQELCDRSHLPLVASIAVAVALSALWIAGAYYGGVRVNHAYAMEARR